MKTLHTFLASILLICAFQTASLAQSTNITEPLKKHFNKTVQDVQNADLADEKRVILNDSFNKMIQALDRIESMASLSEDELAGLNSFKLGLTEKQNELNGLDGFDEIADEELDDFSDYSQDFIEQANRTVTIGIGTAVLVVLLLLLL